MDLSSGSHEKLNSGISCFPHLQGHEFLPPSHQQCLGKPPLEQAIVEMWAGMEKEDRVSTVVDLTMEDCGHQKSRSSY